MFIAHKEESHINRAIKITLKICQCCNLKGEGCCGREEIIIILPESPTGTLPEAKTELPIRETQAVRAEGLSIGCSSITKTTREQHWVLSPLCQTEFIYPEGMDHERLELKGILSLLGASSTMTLGGSRVPGNETHQLTSAL